MYKITFRKNNFLRNKEKYKKSCQTWGFASSLLKYDKFFFEKVKEFFKLGARKFHYLIFSLEALF